MLASRSLPLALLAAAATLAAQTAPVAPGFELVRDTNIAQTSAYLNGVITGDFNNDNKPDYIVAGGATRQDLVLHLGNGDGTFQPPTTIGTVEYPSIVDMAVADVNNDGKLDLIVAGNNNNTSGVTTSEGGFEIFLGNGDGTFQSPLTYTTPYIPNSITTGDFNRDGLIDVAVGDDHGEVEIWNNTGGGAFTLAKSVVITSVANAVEVRAGQFDGDGITHLATQTGGVGVAVAWNDGAENFTVQTVDAHDARTFGFMNVGRVAQDGRDDIILSYQCPPNTAGCSNYAIDVIYGQGAHKTVTTTVVNNWIGISALPWAVDVNNDGIADLVSPGAAGQHDGLYVWLGNADGSFSQTPVVYAASTNGVGAAYPGDFDRTGKMDFVVLMPGDEQSELYLNSGALAPCATRTVSPSVTVCWPADNTYLSSGAYTMLSARAYDTHTVTAMQEYVNSQLSYSADTTSFQQQYAPPPGVYNYVTKAWDNTGIDFVSDRTITAYYGSPGYTCTSSLTVSAAAICLPQGPNSASPAQILANGWTPNVPTAAQLYIDGNLVIDNHPCNIAGNSCEGTSFINTTQTLAVGSHNLVYKLWDNQGNVYQAQQTLTIVGN
ncbi:MAG TPA: VCBS repeat-containing protein [Acidobacteriaceae bacterium]|jgi:hypothetical protein|nr:VCBS repeat-containing protein [Acidobacteriaceae bacterium]